MRKKTGLLLFVLVIAACRPGQSQNENSLPQITPNPLEQYSDCIPWTQARFYDGQRVCVFGRIIDVEYYFDEPSGRGVYTGYFSVNRENSLRIIQVGEDISNWLGQCVVVQGTLSDRDELREYDPNLPPSLVDA